MPSEQNKPPIYRISSPLGQSFDWTLQYLGQQHKPPIQEAGAMPVPLLSQFQFIHEFTPHQEKLPFLTPCRFMLERWVSVN